MNHILTERLRLSVPDIGNLEGFKFVFEIRLKSAGRPVSDADRASAFTGYGPIKHRNLPCVIRLRESGEFVGSVEMTFNLDAFSMIEQERKASFSREKPLEVGIRVCIHHRHRGQGYGLEAANTFIGYVTRVLGARRVVFEARRSEPEAVRLMERLGMTIHSDPCPNDGNRVIGVLQP